MGSSDGRLYAVETAGGQVAWAFEVDGVVYFGSHNGFIYAIEESDDDN